MYFWKIASSRKYNSFRWKAQEITGPILNELLLMKRDEKYLIRQQVCCESIYFDIQTEPCS